MVPWSPVRWDAPRLGGDRGAMPAELAGLGGQRHQGHDRPWRGLLAEVDGFGRFHHPCREHGLWPSFAAKAGKIHILGTTGFSG